MKAERAVLGRGVALPDGFGGSAEIATIAPDSFSKGVGRPSAPPDERISVYLSAMRTIISLRPSVGGSHGALSPMRNRTAADPAIASPARVGSAFAGS